MNNSKELYEQLGAPFPENDLEWRVQRVVGGKNNKNYAIVCAYVTNRAIQERLDQTVGPANWKNEYQPWREKGVLCGISIRIENEWITKFDGADETNIESTKGGFSGASKRAAVVWNIGRYLYSLDECFVEIKDKGDNYINQKVKVQGNDTYIKGYWDTPKLPEWALPGSSQSNSQPPSVTKNNQPSKPNTSSSGKSNSTGNEQEGNAVDSEHHKEYKNKLLTGIASMQNELELNDAYIIAIFNQATKKQYKALSSISQKATIEDLENYYNALRPIAELKGFSKIYSIPLDTICNYVQIVKNIGVNNIMQLFFKLTRDDIKQIKEICQAEVESQQRGA